MYSNQATGVGRKGNADLPGVISFAFLIAKPILGILPEMVMFHFYSTFHPGSTRFPQSWNQPACSGKAATVFMMTIYSVSWLYKVEKVFETEPKYCSNKDCQCGFGKYPRYSLSYAFLCILNIYLALLNFEIPKMPTFVLFTLGSTFIAKNREECIDHKVITLG